MSSKRAISVRAIEVLLYIITKLKHKEQNKVQIHIQIIAIIKIKGMYVNICIIDTGIKIQKKTFMEV